MTKLSLEEKRERHLLQVTERENQLKATLMAALKRTIARIIPLVAAETPVVLAAGDQPTGKDLGLLATIWAEESGDVYYDLVSNYQAGLSQTALELAGVPDPTWAVVNPDAITAISLAEKRVESISEAAWIQVQSMLTLGMDDGATIPEMAKQIQEEAPDLLEWQAERIARTEVVGMTNAGSYAYVDALGEYGPPGKQWLAASDERTRPSHAEANGQIVKTSKKFKVGGHLASYPGDPELPAGEAINCRCTLVWIEDPELVPGLSQIQVDIANQNYLDKEASDPFFNEHGITEDEFPDDGPAKPPDFQIMNPETGLYPNGKDYPDAFGPPVRKMSAAEYKAAYPNGQAYTPKAVPTAPAAPKISGPPVAPKPKKNPLAGMVLDEDQPMGWKPPGAPTPAKTSGGFWDFKADNRAGKEWSERLGENISLTRQERSAITGYTGSEYGPVNGMLRHNADAKAISDIQKSASAAGYKGPYQDYLLEAIDGIDSAMSKASLAEDVVVHRGFYSRAFDELAGSGQLVGRTVMDPAFMSTSVNTTGVMQGHVILHINVPKGARAIPVRTWSSVVSENEVLIDRRSSYKITKVVKGDRFGHDWEVFADLVQDGSGEYIKASGVNQTLIASGMHDLSMEQLERVKALDASLRRSRLSRPVVTFHGINSPLLTKLAADERLTGMVISSSGYTATACEPVTEASLSVLLRIPAKSNALPIVGDAGRQGYLLPRGAKMKVVHVSQSGEGFRVDADLQLE